MNQCKLEVVKQEMARVNVDILGISKLKWTGMGEFNLDDHYIYYCGQESLRRNGVAIMVNKRVLNAVLGCNLKNDRMITYLEPDILECEVNWALGSITINKASGGEGIREELFKNLKYDTVKVLHSTYEQI